MHREDPGAGKAEKKEKENMKRFFKKLWCILTGGHAYSDLTLHAHYNAERDVFVYRNHCAKCGAREKWEVPGDMILPELVRNEVEFDG